MIRPLPSQHPSTLPSARHCPDPQHIEDLSRLGDEITEMAAHLAAGTCQLLEFIAIFDEEGGWQGPGIASCANWLNWKHSRTTGLAPSISPCPKEQSSHPAPIHVSAETS